MRSDARPAPSEKTATQVRSIPTLHAPSERPTSSRLTYQPALDGLRGIAVALVVVFHLDVGVFRGGYLGVSVFFTLSGFLITSLLIDEWNDRIDCDRPGIDLGRFYLRRVRRLVPASVATLLAVAVLAALGVVARTSVLRGDLIAAAWNAFNWRELTSGGSYADLFRSESAVAHFWSLAIEEQFYLVWPLTMLFVLRRVRSRRVLLGILAILFVVSALSAIPASSDVTYFATWTRAAEILAGALLGAWMSTSVRTSWPEWWRWILAPALMVLIVASILTPTSSGWAYSGGLAVFSLVSVALIAGLQHPGRITSVIACKPLVALGRISYGVYLVHWPVFVVLDERRLAVDGWSLAVVRLAVTATIAVVMFFCLERPIRLSPRAIRPLAGAATAIAAMSIVTITAISVGGAEGSADPAPAVIGVQPAAAQITPAPRPGGVVSGTATVRTPTSVAPTAHDASARDDASAGTDSRAATATGEGAVSAAPTSSDDAASPTVPIPAIAEPSPPTPVTIAVFGDSVPAWLLRDSAQSFTRSDVVILNGAQEACDGMVALPVGRDRRGTELVPPDDCYDWTVSYPKTLANAPRTDLAVLVVGQAPVIDHLVDGEWHGPCDSIDWYLDDLTRRVEFLRAQGIRPILALPARFGQRVTYIVPDDQGERIGCVRSAMLGWAAGLDVEVVDLDQFLCPNDDCEVLRTGDGIHIDPAAAPDVLNEILDRVLEIGDTPP